MLYQYPQLGVKMAAKKEEKLAPYPPKGAIEKLNLKDWQSLSSQIQRDFGNAEQTKWLWIPERAEDLKNYFGVTPPAEWPFKGASRIKSQFQRIIVDTFSGNVLKSIFSPEHPIAVVPSPLSKDSSNDTLENIKYVEDLHNSLQDNEYNLREVLDKAIPTSLIESFVVLHPVYEYRCDEVVLTVKRYIPKELKLADVTYDVDTDTVSTTNGQLVPSYDDDKKYMTEAELKSTNLKQVEFHITKEEVIKDGVSVKMINGYRFYMPLGSPGETPYEKIQRAPYTIHQVFYTLREVKNLQETGYFENTDPIVATVYDRQRELLTYIKLQQAGFLLDTARLEYEYVEVLKWCGVWNVNGKPTNLIVWLDRNSNQIFRVEINVMGIKPYFPICPFPVDETPYGESLCKIIRPLVKELDMLLRMISNMAIMKAAPPRFFDPASGFNPSTVGAIGPAAWIPTREPSKNILIPPTPEDPRVSMELVQLLINIIERITGVNEVVQGQISDKTNTTAYEVNTALTRSGVRFDSIYERIKRQLKPMFKYIHKLTLRHMPETKEVLLMGAENKGRLVRLHKMMLQGQFEFNLTGGSVVAEQTQLQNALTLYQTLGQHPYTSYKPESIYYILYNIVRRLNPVALDKILPKPEEVEELERSKAQVQAEQEQLAMQQQGPSPEEAKLQLAQQELQMRGVEQQQNMVHKENEHGQKLRHQEEKHKQDMALMQQKLQADQMQHEIQIAQMKEKAHAQAKAAEKATEKKS